MVADAADRRPRAPTAERPDPGPAPSRRARLWARIGIVALFLALLRILAEYLRLEFEMGRDFTVTVGHPWVVGALIAAGFTFFSVLLHSFGRHRASALVSALAILVLLAYKFLLGT